MIFFDLFALRNVDIRIAQSIKENEMLEFLSLLADQRNSQRGRLLECDLGSRQVMHPCEYADG